MLGDFRSKPREIWFGDEITTKNFPLYKAEQTRKDHSTRVLRETRTIRREPLYYHPSRSTSSRSNSCYSRYSEQRSQYRCQGTLQVQVRKSTLNNLSRTRHIFLIIHFCLSSNRHLRMVKPIQPYQLTSRKKRPNDSRL